MKQFEQAVVVWIARLSESHDTLPLLESWLDTRERERAARFHFAEDRARFTIGRGLARKLLGAALFRPPAEIQFTSTERERPVLREGGLEFNITHAGDLVAVAFAKNARVGIDIERVERKVDLMGVAERILSEEDFAKFCALPDVEKAATFFRIWTRKEAYLKATGEGITDGLKKISVPLGTEEISSITDLRDESGAAKWRLHSLALPQGYAGCVACDDAEMPIEPKWVGTGF